MVTLTRMKQLPGDKKDQHNQERVKGVDLGDEALAPKGEVDGKEDRRQQGCQPAHAEWTL